MKVEEAIKKYEGQPLTLALLKGVLKGYRWPHNKIRELEKKEILLPVKRGLYLAGASISTKRPSSFLLANHIYGPSYVSLEAALSHWGLIPEKVTAIWSMTTGSTKAFRTLAGRFHYIKLALPYYSFGIRQVALSERETVLMGSPEKALCDLIITKAGINLRSQKQTLDFLVEDLRMELSDLRELDPGAIRLWLKAAPKKGSLDILIKTLEAL